jgi:hypothetical protein
LRFASQQGTAAIEKRRNRDTRGFSTARTS